MDGEREGNTTLTATAKHPVAVVTDDQGTRVATMNNADDRVVSANGKEHTR
jgi:hypothetical protein